MKRQWEGPVLPRFPFPSSSTRPGMHILDHTTSLYRRPTVIGDAITTITAIALIPPSSPRIFPTLNILRVRLFNAIFSTTSRRRL